MPAARLSASETDTAAERSAVASAAGAFEWRESSGADARINRYFAAAASDPARLKAFKGKLVDQICQASGGPCTYTGKDMKTAHMRMGISGAEFDGLVEDLVGGLDKFKVGAREKDQLLGALGPMKGDIVEKK